MCRALWSVPLLPMVLAAFVGCGSGEVVDSSLNELRRQFEADVSPEDALAFEDVRTALQDGKREADTEVVLRGRINAGDISPWEPGVAAFVLTDATGHDDEDDHDPHECPFCSRKIESMIAHVEFHDNDGRVITEDARELFELRDKQLVIVRGRVSLDESGILRLAATEMAVNR